MWRSLPSTSPRAKAVKRSPLRAVADVALLAVEHPGAVGLLDRARLDLVGVGAGLRLGQREAGELAPRREVGQEALLLLVGAEQVDALEADRLVDAEDDRERRVDLGEGLEDPRVAGLGEALAAVLLVDVEPAEAGLAELLDRVVADPALLLDLAVVDALADLARGGVQPADLLLLVRVRLRPREHHLLVDLAEEERLRERGDLALGLVLDLGLGRGFHRATLPGDLASLAATRRASARAPRGGSGHWLPWLARPEGSNSRVSARPATVFIATASLRSKPGSAPSSPATSAESRAMFA